MNKRRYILITTLALAASAAIAKPRQTALPTDRNTALQVAIRQGDLQTMKSLLESGADPNAADSEGTPALINAAIYSSAAHMRALLDKGAKVDSKNQAGATALIIAAGDPEKARLLIERGADVNAQSGPGRTPLLTAAAAAGNGPTVKMLLDKGAKVDMRDRIDPIPVLFTGGGKGTPLIEAARVGDVWSVRYLLRAGADVDAKDAKGVTALSEAVLHGRRDIVKELLASHASVDVAASVAKFPLLSMAGMRGDAEITRMLVRAGAPVNAADVNGGTPLHWAAHHDRVHSDVVAQLLVSGADPRAINKNGESALDWAQKRGNTRVVKMLREAGAPSKPQFAVSNAQQVSVDVRPSAALDILGAGSHNSFKKTGCASCHNHTLPLVAFAKATRSGIAVNHKDEKMMMTYLLSMMKPMTEILLEGSSMPPDMQISGGYILEALSAQNYPADTITAAIVHNVALQQAADGRWIGWAPRPPLEHGDIQATALGIRSLRLYPLAGRKVEMEERIANAGIWLRTAVPVTTEEHIMRTLGLKWAGLPREAREAANQLLRLQRQDGGWAQLSTLSTDAYATGKAVYAIREVLGMTPQLNAALAALRKMQQSDGTWRVQTRSFPFQPLLDSGFPHGRDQWISAAATSWAVMALLPEPGSNLQTRKARPAGPVGD